MLMQENELRSKMDMEDNIKDKMLVDEIVRKTIEEDEKLVIYFLFTYFLVNLCNVYYKQTLIFTDKLVVGMMQ